MSHTPIPTPSLLAPVDPSIRHRITFATARSLAYISVLELGTLWERSLRRAGVAVRYSQGYNPRPKLVFAAPLLVGCGSRADLLDVWLDPDVAGPRPASETREALEGQTPRDLKVLDVTGVSRNEPSLPKQLVQSEYRVWVRGADRAPLAEAIDALLAAGSVPRVRRDREYDLRPLVQALRLEPEAPIGHPIWMRLRARPGATGRPDEVLKALDVIHHPWRCGRVRMILNDPITDSPTGP
jgi:radical SAM-linked protein